jgi:hypothetical protein
MRIALFIATLMLATPASAQIIINGRPASGTYVNAPVEGVPSLFDELFAKYYGNASAVTPMPAPPRATATDLPLPPSPPPVTYTVWAYKWDGWRYVKQDAYTLQTTDLWKAAAHWNQCRDFAGWDARANMPDECTVHILPTDVTTPNGVDRRPRPDSVTYSVWAYKLVDDSAANAAANSGKKWVKDDKFSWTTTDVTQAWQYSNSVNAVPGWCATNNCPPILPQSQRFYEGGIVRGAPQRYYYYDGDDAISWNYHYYTHGYGHSHGYGGHGYGHHR